MVEVKEFVARLEQGYAEAFLCRGADGHLYVTKSRRSGIESLVREWVCGRIGQKLGVPVPPIQLIYASPSVAMYSGNEDLQALSEMPGFGSRFVGTESGGAVVSMPTLNVADVPSIDASLRRRTLLFDWLVLNFDRTDDNPNLLWNPVAGELHVIDHNLAFDSERGEEFWRCHIFRHDAGALSDPDARAGDLARVHAILLGLPAIWGEIPESWTHVCRLSLSGVDRILRRCLNDDFWCVP